MVNLRYLTLMATCFRIQRMQRARARARPMPWCVLNTITLILVGVFVC